MDNNKVSLVSLPQKTPSASMKYPPGKHPNSRKNLKPYPPGVNGNPKPGNSLKAVLLNALLEPLKKPAEDAPARDHVVYATLKGAISCEPTSAHLKEVWDRVEGKLQDKEAIRDINVVFVIGKGYKEIPQLIDGKDATE